MDKLRGWTPFLVQLVLIVGGIALLGVSLDDGNVTISRVSMWLAFGVGFVPLFLKDLTTLQRKLPLFVTFMMLILAGGTC
jgi:hypothetical protein